MESTHKRGPLLVFAMAVLGIVTVSCGGPATTTTPAADGESQYRGMVEDFIRTDATFVFDGVDGSIKFIDSEPGPTSAFRSIVYTYEYQTLHPGHGDRSGKVLAQVIANHAASIVINSNTGKIYAAMCDETWDMTRDQPTTQTVTGKVLSGGDTTAPDGPKDAPRVFAYRVQKADGTVVTVSYTAYPPSPVGDTARAKITLDFHGGEVRVGDIMEASGTLDPNTATIVIAAQGDYIKTYRPQP
jgi:hypothetical protein